MRMIKLNCPSCGAELEAGDDRRIMYCQYCGHKILLDDEALNIRLSFDNAREAGYEFERGRMEAQAQGSPAFETANKLKEMVEPARRLEEIRERIAIDKTRLFSLGRKLKEYESFVGKIKPVFASSLIMIFSMLLLPSHEIPVRYSIGGFLVAFLLAMYNLKKTSSEKEKIETLIAEKKDEYDSLQREYDEIIETYDFHILPEDYWDPEIIDRLYRLLMTSRAVNIQQAIVVFDEEQNEEANIQQRQNELRKQEEHLMALSRAIEEKKDDDDDDDDALSGAAIVGAAIGTAFLLRKLFK